MSIVRFGEVDIFIGVIQGNSNERFCFLYYIAVKGNRLKYRRVGTRIGMRIGVRVSGCEGSRLEMRVHVRMHVRMQVAR